MEYRNIGFFAHVDAGKTTLSEQLLLHSGTIREATFVIPADCASRIMSDVQQMRGEITETESDETAMTLKALVPVATSLDYPAQFASVTHGKDAMSTALHGYRECPLELGRTAARRGVDPLDTAKYILAARSALEGNIFDGAQG